MSLLKNSTWNLLGTAASAAVMVPAMGFFARTLDAESFGLLALVLAFVGYASVLDGGFARAVVREVAAIGANNADIPKIMGTALWVVLAIGVLAALVFVAIAPWLVGLMHVSSDLYIGAVNGFRLSALIAPVILVTMVWLAPMEGLNQFAGLNLIRSVGFALIVGVSIVAVLIEPRFESAVLGLLIGRVLMAALSGWSSSRLTGHCFGAFDRMALQALYRFGGWITVSNLVTPLLDYLDRFVLSIMGGASSLAYYAAPADGMQKMQSLPGAVARALFPLLSARQGEDLRQLIMRALLIQALIGFGVAVSLIAFSDQIIALWLGADFVEASSPVSKILAVGFAFNAMAWVPQTALQAMGYAKCTAFVSMCQILPYVLLLIVLISAFGLVGAAAAWAARAFVDLCLLGWVYRRTILRKAGTKV